MKTIEIETYNATGTDSGNGMTGALAYPAMPDANLCDDTCLTPVDPIESSESEWTCNEDDMEYEIDGTCTTVELCGTSEILDEETGRTTIKLEVCYPKCMDPATIWDTTTEACELIIPPMSCEDKLIPHYSREFEVEERYLLQQTIMFEQNDRHRR